MFQAWFDVWKVFANFVLVGVYRKESLESVYQFFFSCKQDSVSCDICLSNVLKHAAYLVLDHRDLSTNLCLKDLACTSWIWYLT